MHRFVYISVFLATATWAGTVYKSVDEKGNVIYSETPPAESEATEALDLPPEPSKEEVEEARERDKILQEHLESTNNAASQPEGDQPAVGESGTQSGEAGVGTDWRTRREEERQRAVWGKDWPIHHPRHK